MIFPTSQLDPPRVAVRVKRKAVPFVRNGHPWLFEDSVEQCRHNGKPGDTAVLFDPDGKFIGAGLLDPESTVRVKILTCSAADPHVGPDLFACRIRTAKSLREGKIPSGTTAWRLLHGESDGFPGLIADRYENVLVMKLYSAAWCPHAAAVVNALQTEYPDLDTAVIRLSRELGKMPETARCGLTDGSVFPAGFPGRKIFRENGIRFEADLITGQKTGFFLDQRDNRSRVEKLSAGCDVLNVFSFSGGFSLYAARGGARNVVSVDFDRHALEACVRNFKLNEKNPAIRACRHSEIRGDAFDVMEQLAKDRRTFGVVIVDPPSFAKSSADVPLALKSYFRLAKAAVKLVKPDGILVFASCSSRATPDDVFGAVDRAAEGQLEVLEKTFHAVDHPAKFAESGYLKCLWARKRK